MSNKELADLIISKYNQMQHGEFDIFVEETVENFKNEYARIFVDQLEEAKYNILALARDRDYFKREFYELKDSTTPNIHG